MNGTVYVAWEPLAGTTVEKAAKEAIEMAQDANSTIILLFNGVYIRANPDSSASWMVAYYHRQLGDN